MYNFTTGADANFSNGYYSTNGSTYSTGSTHYIDFGSSNCSESDGSDHITVQGSFGNNLLFVSSAIDNSIYRFDKTTGAALGVGAFTVNNPGDMTISTSTGGLWVITASTTAAYYTNLTNSAPTEI